MKDESVKRIIEKPDIKPAAANECRELRNPQFKNFRKMLPYDK